MSANRSAGRKWTTRIVGRCPICQGDVWQKYGPGQPKRYCKNACRQRAYRERKFVELLEQYKK